jgi:hypothetical protein
VAADALDDFLAQSRPLTCNIVDLSVTVARWRVAVEQIAQTPPALRMVSL